MWTQTRAGLGPLERTLENPESMSELKYANFTQPLHKCATWEGSPIGWGHEYRRTTFFGGFGVQVLSKLLSVSVLPSGYSSSAARCNRLAVILHIML